MIRRLALAAAIALVAAPLLSLHHIGLIEGERPLRLLRDYDNIGLVGLAPILPGTLF